LVRRWENWQGRFCHFRPRFLLCLLCCRIYSTIQKTAGHVSALLAMPCGQKSQPSLKHFEKGVSRHAPGSHLSQHHVHIFSRKGCPWGQNIQPKQFDL
jgi:hypothetical protein